MTPLEALQKAIEVAGGSPLALARKIGGRVVRQNVEYWVEAGRAPAEHCPAIERETGVRCEDLQPDVAWEVLREQAKAA